MFYYHICTEQRKKHTAGVCFSCDIFNLFFAGFDQTGFYSVRNVSIVFCFYRCSTAAPLSLLKMYSFMGGGLFCAIVGNILLVVSTATDYWMQYRLSGNYAHQGLWRYCMSNKCYMQTDSIGKRSRVSSAHWTATVFVTNQRSVYIYVFVFHFLILTWPWNKINWISLAQQSKQSCHTCLVHFCLFSPSLLECHQGLHDPFRDVVLCRHHCWHHVLCALFLLWKVQPLLCRRNHVFCLKWVVFLLSWQKHTNRNSNNDTRITDMCIPISLSAFFVLLAMAIYTGVTINFLGKRFGDWRFSWSYILGWVAMLMTFFAGEKEHPVAKVNNCLSYH